VGNGTHAQNTLISQRKPDVESRCSKFPKSAREIRVGDCVFDVVAYDKQEKLFRLVECKRGSQATSIGHAFGQIAAYWALLADKGQDFLDAFSRKVSLRFHRLMEATDGARRFRVAFYVALTDEACQRVDLLRSLKRLLPDVGVIRVKRDGKCRDYVRDRGRKDFKLALAQPTVVKISSKRSASQKR
jgi:hypothetical protein